MRAGVRSSWQAVLVSAISVIIVALSFTACGNGASPGSAASSPAGSAPAASTPTASSEAEFGVAECDRYVKVYLACLDRMAPEARVPARTAFDQTRASWKLAASTEQGRVALAATCTAASDAAAPAMRAQGCVE